MAWTTHRKRLIFAIVACSLLFVYLRSQWHTRVAVRADRPLEGLGLSDDQARQIEDWAEAHPFVEEADGAAADEQARDAFMQSLLTPAQRNSYARLAHTPAACLNPWCISHGRISTPARIMGWTRRHLPPGDWRVTVISGGRAALLEGASGAAVRFYVCEAGQPVPPKLAPLGLQPLPAPAYARLTPKGWCGFARIDLSKPERPAFEEVFRQALAIDGGRVHSGLRAVLTDDPRRGFGPADPVTLRVGQPLALHLGVVNVGDDPEANAPYVGPEMPPPYLALTLVTPDGISHELPGSTGERTGPAPGPLGWGGARWRAFDLRGVAGAAELLARPGAYTLTGLYAPAWPAQNILLPVGPVRLTLIAPE